MSVSEALSCDVLVVGAGPAGSTVARIAAEAGVQVLLVDSKAAVGVPVQCAGYVSKAICWHVSLADECVVQPVEGLRTYLPDGTVQETPVPGYILNRAALDRQLAADAVRAGARLLLRTRIFGRREDGVVALGGGRSLLIRTPIIVGADGPRSSVARWMGVASPRLARALQYEMALRGQLSAAEVYFRQTFRGGYAWLFPSGDKCSVGAAFLGNAREGAAGLKALLRELEAVGKVTGPVLSFTAGFVPVSGPDRLCQSNMLLVGDAGGHAHPVTGAGIVNAIIAGEMAGRAAVEAVSTAALDRLGDYEEEWREVLGPTMERALEKRFRLEQKWNSSPTELSLAIRQSWIGFDDYYNP